MQPKRPLRAVSFWSLMGISYALLLSPAIGAIGLTTLWEELTRKRGEILNLEYHEKKELFVKYSMAFGIALTTIYSIWASIYYDAAFWKNEEALKE